MKDNKCDIWKEWACIICYPVLLIGVLVLASGCVATQPFPNVARAGDTITIAVGSSDGMATDNTTVEFYPGTDPSAVTPVPVPVRSIFKIYPDKTSLSWLTQTAIPKRSSHGGWLSVVSVDLPGSLPAGDGIIRVTTNGEVTYPRFSATVNGTDMMITILAGTGAANPLDYYSTDGVTNPGDLSELEELRQVVVKPPVPAEGTAEFVQYGAIELDLTIPIIDLLGGAVVDAGIAVVLDDQPQISLYQTNMVWKRDGDNYKIMLMSPKGMYSYQSRISIVPIFPDYLYVINGTPMLNSITYYDLDGVLSSGPTPTLTVIN